MKDDIAKELLEPLAGEYASTSADRERIRAKLRERLEGAVLVGTTSTATSWLAGRRLLGAVVGLAGIATVGALGGAFSSRASLAKNEQNAPFAAPAVTQSGARPVGRESGGEPVIDQAPTPTVTVDALPSVAAEATVALPSKRVAPPPRAEAHGDDDLVRETRLMAKANEVMRSGDLGGALALFDQHAGEFPRGVLADERIVSRVVILCRLDRRHEAMREGEAFLQTHPPSPLTRRIESSCAGLGEGSEGRAP